MEIRLDGDDDKVVLSGECDVGSLRYEITSCSDEQDAAEQEEGGPSTGAGMQVLRAKGDYRQAFGLRYLTTFAKAAQLCGHMTCFLEPDYPIMLSYEFMQDSELRFHLAPKIEDSEDEMEED